MRGLAEVARARRAGCRPSAVASGSKPGSRRCSARRPRSMRPGADQQDHRQRDFGHQQRDAPASPAAAAGPSPLLEGVVQVDPRRPQRRKQAEDRARQHRDRQGEAEDASHRCDTWRRKRGELFRREQRVEPGADRRQADAKAPPATDSSRFSVRSCFISRPRPAPAAARRASSFCLPTPATSSRLATFAQPMSRTKPTVPTRKVSTRSVPPNSASCNGHHARTHLPRLLAAGFFQLSADGGRFGRCRIGGDARFQPADRRHPPCMRNLPEVARRPEGDVLDPGRQHESARHHAEDDARLAIDADRPADGVRGARRTAAARYRR